MQVFDTSLVQLYPSRVTVTNNYPQNATQKMVQRYLNKLDKDQKINQYQTNFKKPKNAFTLSQASKRKLMDSINSMYCLSKPRTITMRNKKKLFKFQLSFITLTLPSTQKHDDLFIKSECLNQFLIELRKNYDVNNYVWKAELQKNENIHFHLITDQYIDFQALRRRWNRILNKFDYVKNYQQKMEKLTLNEYHRLRCKGNKITFQESAKAYAKGKRSKWLNPNSVDVKTVRSKKDLAVYLAKYVTKKADSKKSFVQDLEREKKFGRSWSRSYSLAKLKYQSKLLVSEIKEALFYLDNVGSKVKKIIGDFFVAYYFNLRSLREDYQKFHNFFITSNAIMHKYPFPT